MGNKRNDERPTDAQIEASKQIYEAARSEANIEIAKLKNEVEVRRGEGEAIGILKKIRQDRDYNDLIEALVLYRVKENKSYKQGGLTWEKFCEVVGIERKTADNIIDDIRPIFQKFTENVSGFFGIEFRKIRYLGKSITENFAKIQDNAIVYQGETIPLTPEHRDDIQSIIEKIEESYKKQLEDKEIDLRVKDREIKAKEDVIGRMEKDIQRLEKTVEMTDLTPEEQEAVDLLVKAQSDFMKMMTTIKQKISYEKSPAIALRQLYFLYIFIAKVMMDERLALHEVYKDAEEVPWELTEEELPPTGALIDNMPLTYGRGMGKKVEKRIGERLKGEA